MNKTITALKVQKKNKERVSIYLDGEFAFGVSLSLMAVRYLSYRQRTEQEMVRYLTGKEFSDEVIATTVERLLEYRYLNDEEFARSWVADRNRLRPRSARALRYELRQKGVSNQILDEVLQELDEVEAAWNAVHTKLDRWRGEDEWAFKKKVGAFLGRRGFNYDVVRSVVERALESDA